jgi:hypothetical protein
MKLTTTALKVLSIFAFALGLSLPALAESTPTTGMGNATCWWGDASFEDGCANASAAATARANELARLARAHKATLAVATSSQGSVPSGNAAFGTRTANGTSK